MSAAPERSALPVLASSLRPERRRWWRRGRSQPKHLLESPAKSVIRTNMVLWCVVIVTSGFVAGTTAAFNASTGEGSSIFGATALVEPSGNTLTVAGASLTMGVDSFGSVLSGGGTVGVRWRYYWPTASTDSVSSQGTPPSCSAAFASYNDAAKDLGSSLSGSKTVAYPTTVGGVSTDGRWICAMAMTTYPATDPVGPAQQWLSQVDNPVTYQQLGHVVQSVQLQNGGASATGTLSTGDQIIVTFNQDVDATGRVSPTSICMRDSGGGNRILLGRVSVNCNVQADNLTAAVQIGNLHWLGTGNLVNNSFNVTSTWTTNNILTMVLTSGTQSLANCTVGQASTGCFELRTQYTNNPGSALESASGAKALCTAQPAGTPDTGVCWPKTTGRP